MSIEPVLRVEGLSKKFGDKQVLKNIEFELYAKDSLVVLGGSGTGKSVLIKSIIGIIQPDTGKIFIHGIDVSTLSRKKREKLCLSIGMLFQGGALFDSLSVLENITFGLEHAYKMDKKKAAEIAYETLKDVELDAQVADQYPSELSGGMQKRVSLARAIAMDPSIIFFDEPTTGLDPIVSHSINQLIASTTQKSAALTITHDLKSMRAIAKHIAVLKDGVFVWKGTIDEIEQTEHPYVRQFLDI